MSKDPEAGGGEEVWWETHTGRGREEGGGEWVWTWSGLLAGRFA